MGLTKEEAQEWAGLHPPEAVRWESTTAHRILGVLLFVAAIVALLASFGVIEVGTSLSIWPGLAILAGALLTLGVFFFHHGIAHLALAAKVNVYDPEQRTHVAWALLTAAVGVAEILRAASIIPDVAGAAVLPVVLVLLGLLFVFHSAHGTPEAIQILNRYHRILGTAFVVTGGLKGAQLAFPAFPDYPWAAGLFVVGLLLVTYREPKGAHEWTHWDPSHGGSHHGR